MLSEICLPKVFRNFTEATEAPETIFQKCGGACRPVASSLSNLTSKMFWKGLDSNFYLHPYLDKFTPRFCVFGCFLSETLQNFYGLCNDTHFLSEMLQNFMGLRKNALFDFRNVAKLYGLRNDGC